MFDPEQAEQVALDALLRLHGDLALGGGPIRERGYLLHLARAYTSRRVQARIRKRIMQFIWSQAPSSPVMEEPEPEGSSESSLNSMRPAASREMFDPEEAERVALDALRRLHGDLTLGGGLIHEWDYLLHLARAYRSRRVQAHIRELVLWQATNPPESDPRGLRRPRYHSCDGCLRVARGRHLFCCNLCQSRSLRWGQQRGLFEEDQDHTKRCGERSAKRLMQLVVERRREFARPAGITPLQ